MSSQRLPPPGGHKHPIFPVRLDPKLRKYVDELALKSHISASAAVRMAIMLAYREMIEKGKK